MSAGGTDADGDATPETATEPEASTVETPADAEPEADADDGLDRRRLIRWIAAIAFGVPVVIELVTFGGLFYERLFGTESGASGVGVGDELLPETAATETVRRSAVRGTGADRTYVLRVSVDNPTETTVALRLSTLELADGSTVESVAATGDVPPGETGELTGAWSLGADGTPERVQVRALRDDEVVADRAVAVAVSGG